MTPLVDRNGKSRGKKARTRVSVIAVTIREQMQRKFGRSPSHKREATTSSRRQQRPDYNVQGTREPGPMGNRFGNRRLNTNHLLEYAS